VALASTQELIVHDAIVRTTPIGGVDTFADSRRSRTPPLGFVAVVILAAVGATAWSAHSHSMLVYGDARAHLDVARHVTDGLRTGLTQLGSVSTRCGTAARQVPSSAASRSSIPQSGCSR